MKTFFPLSAVGKPKITDAVRIVEQTLAFRQAQKEALEQRLLDTRRPCPIPDCIAGERDNTQNMGPRTPKCPVCMGTGYVDLAHTCCCGMPAVLLHEYDQILYCGRDLCLNVQRRRMAG